MRVLFIHGGGDGAYAFDRDLSSGLADALHAGISIDYPHLEGLEQIDWEKTAPQLTTLLDDVEEREIVVAHSIGASAVLKVLAGGASSNMRHLFLLAPPYKGADSHWGIDPFTFPDGFPSNVPSTVAIAIYHCEDDEIIPVRDAIDYREKLPAAKITLFKRGGHQFDGNLEAIATDIHSMSS